MIEVNFGDIVNAYRHINPYIQETPLITSEALSREFGGQQWLKLESFQETGSFKLRGALNHIMTMRDEELDKGVVTVSSGNHAKAVAYASKLKGISAVVCVPESSPLSKRQGILNYGAELIVYGKDYAMAEKKAREIEEKSQRKFVHSYEAAQTIAAQGTIVLECLLKEGFFDIILVPVGGGGLLCGSAMAAKSIFPDTKVYGIQTEASAPWYNSFYNRELDNDYPFKPSCADGLQGEIGWPAVELALKWVDGILVVKEETTKKAVKWMAHEHKLMIEASSATTLAALFEQKLDFSGKRVLSLITGGNIDLQDFCQFCC